MNGTKDELGLALPLALPLGVALDEGAKRNGATALDEGVANALLEAGANILLEAGAYKLLETGAYIWLLEAGPYTLLEAGAYIWLLEAGAKTFTREDVASRGAIDDDGPWNIAEELGVMTGTAGCWH